MSGADWIVVGWCFGVIPALAWVPALIFWRIEKKADDSTR